MLLLHITYTEQKSAPSIDQILSAGADLMWTGEMVYYCSKEDDDVHLLLCVTKLSSFSKAHKIFVLPFFKPGH